MSEPRIDNEWLRDRFDRFNEIGATSDGGVNRPALSAANRAARDTLVEWLEELGCSVIVDEMGNIFGRYAGQDPAADPVVIGSHIDSQMPGGRFDGVVGVLGGLAVVEAMQTADYRPKRPIEIVSWTNEEGVRFQPDMMGSGVFAGELDRDEMYASTDADGQTVEAALERIGYKGSRACEPRNLHRYVELHAEQGPQLAETGRSVAAVEQVVGFTWLRIRFTGQADHAGPTPMSDRTDALVGASEVVTAVRDRTTAANSHTVGTVGSLAVEPDGINVIPETVEFTVDIRSPDPNEREETVSAVRGAVKSAAEREGLDWSIDELMTVDSTDFDPEVVATIESAIEATGHQAHRMVSGAGHDASYLASVCPTGMIFIPSEGGISHSETEYTEWADVVTGTEVLLRTCQSLVAH